MNVQVNTEEWLDARRGNIGGSEAAALFGLSKYETEFGLYHRKLGNIDEPSFDNDRVLAGQIMEPAIAKLAEAKFDIKLRQVRRYITHPRVKGMAASLDFETVHSPRIPAEIKNVDYMVFRDEWETDGDIITVCPEHIQIQLQHQMSCTGTKECLIFALVGGNRLCHGRFKYIGNIAEKIERKVEMFWADVAAGHEPAINGARDLGILKDLYRVSDKREPVDLRQDNEAINAAHQLSRAMTDRKAAEAKQKEAMAVLLDKLRGAPAAILPGFKLTMSDIKAQRIEASDRRAYRKMNFKKLPDQENAA